MTFNDCRMAINGTSTLRDVAERAGVSVATASRVMRGDEVVAEQTKARVLSAIADLQYCPNGNAVELSKKRGRTRKRRLRVPDGAHVRNTLENDSTASSREIRSAEFQNADNLRLKRLIETVLKDLAKWTAEAELISGSNGVQGITRADAAQGARNTLTLMDPIDGSAKISKRRQSIHRGENTDPD